MTTRVPALKASRLRGLRLQRARREGERMVRVEAVAFTRWSRVAHGWKLARAAEALRLSPPTLRRWVRRWKTDHMKLEPRGRPVDQADREVRQDVLLIFTLMGPSVGLP